ncbi:MAG: non-canonical purine NTP pyrophosphatase, RdgB/HAM1 family [Robiginitomaculum sp.]|nr:MAG: non-canonical purine NTP pyrophosphatase, RdgB/HAM1 family [Robiginitomaculum sp.]
MRHPITRLVVASHNEGKVREIRELLKPFGVTTFSARELDLPEPEETGLTFAANAELKAQAAADTSGMIALADDSGLAVDALNGEPGIYSARWAELPDGSGRDFDYAMARVYEDMKNAGTVDTARFICALSLAFPNADVHTYEGKVEGRIVWPPRGDKGFGYDPIFQAIGDSQTFAEIEPQAKHDKSHRADAFAKFIKIWFPNKTSGNTSRCD